MDFVRTSDVKGQIKLSGNDTQAVSMTGKKWRECIYYYIDLCGKVGRKQLVGTVLLCLRCT